MIEFLECDITFYDSFYYIFYGLCCTALRFLIVSIINTSTIISINKPMQIPTKLVYS